MADAKRTLRECLDERLKEGRARGLERRPPLLDMAGLQGTDGKAKALSCTWGAGPS